MTEDQGETSQTSSQATDPVNEIDGKLEAFKSEIISEIKNQTAPKPQAVTEADIKKLFAEDPGKAIDLAIERKVNEKVSIYDRNHLKSEYDKKAEQDFPMLKSDKNFQGLVKERVRELIGNGEMTKDSPTLILRASQLAALNYKKTESKSETSSEAGSEAPTGIRQTNQTKRGQNFDAMSKMFGLNDKGKDYAERRMNRGTK